MTTMILAPTPVQQFFDNNGAFLVGGLLFAYIAGTTTKQNVYTNSSGATPLPNPIVLNARGEVAPSANGTSSGLWMDPTLGYKLVLAPANDTDPPTNPFWTVDNIVSPQAAVLAALATYEASLAGVQIGSIIPYGGSAAPTGWLLCYGQAVSRTFYSALFAVVGIAFGAADGSSTFNLPDLRGRLALGADNMGGSAANRVTSAGSGVDASVVGNTGGNQLAQADTLAAVTTLNLSVTESPHVHAQYYTTDFPGSGYPEGGVSNARGPGTQSPDMNTASASTGVKVTGSASTSVTSALTGDAQNMPPVQVTNWIIFANA